MIDYRVGKGKFGDLELLLYRAGSVFPKSFFQAIPSGVLAIVIHHFFYTPDVDSTGVGQIWFGFTFALGFLVVFRTQLAYNRYWEGATLLSRTTGQWFNATSSLFAFCAVPGDKDLADEDPKETKARVKKFKNYLVRLMSLLHCAALQYIASMKVEDFEVFHPAGISRTSLEHLDKNQPRERCLIILQWIQRLIMDAYADKTLIVEPPILSRVFQELAQGIVNVTDAEKLSSISFPFPYAQMLTIMLVAASIITPCFAGLLMNSVLWAVILSFLSIFALWSINDIAAEIECPFGDDTNDLPIDEVQVDMNNLLKILLQDLTQVVPSFHPEANQHLQRVRLNAPLGSMHSMHKGVEIAEGSGASGTADLQHVTTEELKFAAVSVNIDGSKSKAEDLAGTHTASS